MYLCGIFVFKAIILTKLPVRNVCYFIVSPQRLYCFWARHFYGITCSTVSYPSPQSLQKGDFFLFSIQHLMDGVLMACSWAVTEVPSVAVQVTVL